MFIRASKTNGTNDKLFSGLLGEVSCIQELLDSLEGDSMNVEEALSLISGIQRDIVQLYRAAQ